MEVQRRYRSIHVQEQENVYANKGKNNAVPAKKQGTADRGALGELSTNVQITRDTNNGKVAVTTAEFEKKATINRSNLISNYSHVQSKVDTGLSARFIQPAPRPPLRREESTAGLAAKAVARSRSYKENKTAENKESINFRSQTKRTTKLPTVKDNKEVKPLKPIIKESTENLRKLKIDEPKPSVKQLINLNPVIEEEPELPDDIEDIDAKDHNNLCLMTIYIKDIYRYLSDLELKYKIEPEHLKNQVIITGKMRSTLIDWLFEVQQQFGINLETLHLTVGIIDRYLQAVPDLEKNRLQLLGVTAMFIASKYEEVYPPDIGDFVYVTDNAYTKADIFKCERDIMSKLRFCLARPIPLSFLRRFVKAAHGTSKNHHLAKYFVDLCLIEYFMAHYRPSELAAAATCLSLFLLSSAELEEVWTPTLSYYSGYSLEHLTPIISKIAKIVINVEKSNYKAVYNKYLDRNLAKVAALPQLKCDAIHELAKS